MKPKPDSGQGSVITDSLAGWVQLISQEPIKTSENLETLMAHLALYSTQIKGDAPRAEAFYDRATRQWHVLASRKKVRTICGRHVPTLHRRAPGYRRPRYGVEVSMCRKCEAKIRSLKFRTPRKVELQPPRIASWDEDDFPGWAQRIEAHLYPFRSNVTLAISLNDPPEAEALQMCLAPPSGSASTLETVVVGKGTDSPDYDLDIDNGTVDSADQPGD